MLSYAYGTRQADFAMLGTLMQREITEECHAMALMMGTARDILSRDHLRTLAVDPLMTELVATPAIDRGDVLTMLRPAQLTELADMMHLDVAPGARKATVVKALLSEF